MSPGLFFFHVALIMFWGRAGSVGKMYIIPLEIQEYKMPEFTRISEKKSKICT